MTIDEADKELTALLDHWRTGKPDDAGRWYDEQRLCADFWRQQIPHAATPQDRAAMVRRLESALYVGD